MDAITKTTDIVFLCSGGGGNLRFVHQAIGKGWLAPARLVAVLTDRECPAGTYASACGIEHQVLDFKQPDQSEVVVALHKYTPSIIVTNVHRILRPPVTEAFAGRLLNLHYSLLPAFGGSIGAKSLDSAMDYGVKLAGVTAHHVDAALDGGRPVVQAAFPLTRQEDESAAMDVMFRAGCLALLAALRSFAGEEGETSAIVQIKNKPCLFAGDGVGLLPAVVQGQDESFWQAIASNVPASA